MPQSLYALNTHIVFSTKQRRPCLTEDVRPRVWAYMSRILQNIECKGITIGGVADHVHILCSLSKKHAPMKVLEMVKKDSSKFVKTLGRDLGGFHWQDGYGLFSVSATHVEAVRQYIQNQERHHRRVSFEDEFRRILKKNGVEFDERYVWD